MKRFQLVAIRPVGTPFGLAWTEGLESLRYGLLALGFDAPVEVNRIPPGRTPIIFGAHHLHASQIEQLPADTILYNFEQLLPGYRWFQPPYVALLRRFQVWDYAAPNVRWLHESGVAPNAHHLPPGYVAQWTRIQPAREDIDVLFYGLVSPRRRRILDGLAGRGMRLKELRGVFGEERDRWIARARIVLNLRLEDDGHFESLRVNYLLANRKAVVTEQSADDDWPASLHAGVRSVAYDALASACEDLLANEAARGALAEAGFQRIRSTQHQMTTLLGAIPGFGRGKMAAQ